MNINQIQLKHNELKSGSTSTDKSGLTSFQTSTLLSTQPAVKPKDNVELVSELLKSNISLTKERLEQALKLLLSEGQPSKGLVALKIMIQRELELTQSVFKSIMAALYTSDNESDSNVDQLINRISGQQILAHDSGPLQQTILQLPLQLGTKVSDISIHWNGKKRKDGKVDPNHCHILFYLELEGLNQTVLDVRIIDRVITISILNEEVELDESIKSNETELRGKLEELHYTLSSVKQSPLVEKKVISTPKLNGKRNSTYNRGVDIII